MMRRLLEAQGTDCRRSRGDRASRRRRASWRDCVAWKLLPFVARPLPVLLILSLAIFATPASAVVAQDPAPGATQKAAQPAAGTVQITDIRLGFAGHYKVGYWTPVWVTLKSGPGYLTGHLELETADSDGVPVVFRTTGENQIVVPDSGEIVMEAAVKFGRPRGELHVSWRGANAPSDAADAPDSRHAVAARRTFLASESGRAWPHSQLLVVTVGSSVGVEDAARFLAPDATRVTAALVASPVELPTQWFAYEGVDVVVVPTSDAKATEQLDDDRFVALDQWLKLGGRLIWCVGVRGRDIFADGSRFQTWSPGRFVEVGPVARTSALEAFAGSSERLESTGDGGGRRTGRLDMCVLSDVRGRIDAPEGGISSGDRPMVIRYPVGLGQAVLATLDLDQPPLATWSGRRQVLARMFQHAKENVSDGGAADRSGQLIHLGFDDLSGQLRGALDQYPGQTFVSFSWVAVILVVYILLIGPADYFLLRAWSRPHWTWGTLSLVVLLFVGLAYYLNGLWKDSRLRVNQLDVVDVDLDSSLIRGTHWSNLYSPQSDLYDLSLTPVAERFELLAASDQAAGTGPSPDTASATNAARSGSSRDRLPAMEPGQLSSWQGLPGRGLGGLASATATAAFDQPYAIDEDSSTADFARLPIPVAGTKSLGARWWRQATRAATVDRGDLSSASLEEQLQGECVNPLPVTLSEWYLCYGNWLYRGDRELAPGEIISISQFPATRYLDWQLTRRRVSTEHKDISTPWDQSSFDLARIVEMMMFHESAGGSAYTRLGHRYQGYLDLTDHLRTGRAILVGRATGPAVRLQRSDQSLDDHYDQQATYYRVVFPVTIKKQVPGGGRR